MTDIDDNLCAEQEDRNDPRCPVGKTMTLSRRGGVGDIAFPASGTVGEESCAFTRGDDGGSGGL